MERLTECGTLLPRGIFSSQACSLSPQELLPPKFESSSESSDDEADYPGENPLGFDDPWSLGQLEVPEKLDMSDLWVTEDTVPLTDSKPGRKYSISRHKYVRLRAGGCHITGYHMLVISLGTID